MTDPAQRPVSRLLPPLLAIAVGGLLLRLRDLPLTGIGGNDTIYYYTLAEYWLRGDLAWRIADGVTVFRPVTLATNALALQFFGHTDYAIKLANVLFDSANLVLVAALAWRLSRSYAATLASAAVYACLPLAIWASRQELPHTGSTFWVGCTVYSVVWALTPPGARTPWRLLPAGCFLGIAAMTHEELVLLAPPLAVFIVLAARRNAPTPGRGALWLAAFLGPPAAAAVLLLLAAWDQLWPVLAGAFDPAGFFPETAVRFLWSALLGSQSTLAAVAFLLALASLLVRAGDRFWPAFCLLVPAIFVAGYALLLDSLFPRAFLPLVPLVIVGLFLALDRLLCSRGPVAPALGATALAFFLVLANLASYSAYHIGHRDFSRQWAAPALPTPANLAAGTRAFLVDARYVSSYATHWQAIYALLREEVDADNRLLVLPSGVIFSPGRRPLQTEVYFGDNAVYRLDHHRLSLAAVVQRYNISWVLHTNGQLRRPPKRLQRYEYGGRWASRETIDLAQSYGMAEYSREAEYQQLIEFLAAAGGERVMAFPQDSFEDQVAALWYLPSGSP